MSDQSSDITPHDDEVAPPVTPPMHDEGADGAADPDGGSETPTEDPDGTPVENPSGG